MYVTPKSMPLFNNSKKNRLNVRKCTKASLNPKFSSSKPMRLERSDYIHRSSSVSLLRSIPIKISVISCNCILKACWLSMLMSVVLDVSLFLCFLFWFSYGKVLHISMWCLQFKDPNKGCLDVLNGAFVLPKFSKPVQ